MEQLTQFIQNHWALCAAFGATLIVLLVTEIKSKATGIPKISPQTAILLLNREHAVIIDLREQKTFAHGHILGATNIAGTNLPTNIKKLERHKNNTLILVDDSGISSASIGTKLQQQGFTKVHILAGGIQAWKNAQLPLTKN